MKEILYVKKKKKSKRIVFLKCVFKMTIQQNKNSFIRCFYESNIVIYCRISHNKYTADTPRVKVKQAHWCSIIVSQITVTFTDDAGNQASWSVDVLILLANKVIGTSSTGQQVSVHQSAFWPCKPWPVITCQDRFHQSQAQQGASLTGVISPPLQCYY